MFVEDRKPDGFQREIDEVKTMLASREDSKFQAKRPDFVNGKFGVSIWRNSKDGKEWLSLKLPLLLGDSSIAVFPVDSHEEESSVPEEEVK